MGLKSGEMAEAPRPMRHMSRLFSIPTVHDDLGFSPVWVVSFLYFGQPVPLATARAVLRERLCAIDRFASRIEPTRGGFAFARLGDRCLDAAMAHLVQERPGIETQADVDSFVSGLATQRLPLDLPQWRVYVTGTMADGRTLLLFQVNHAVADGDALVEVLMSMLDTEDGAPIRMPRRRGERRSVPLWQSICGMLRACWGPIVADQLPGDPQNRLKVPDPHHPGLAKSFHTSAPIPLEEVQEVRKAIPGATVNDVLMTVAALALREYFLRHEPATLRQKVRAGFPVNIRETDGRDILTPAHFGNRFSQGQLRLPLHLEDPLRVMADVKRQADLMKASPEPGFRDFLLRLVITKSGLSYANIAHAVLSAYGKVTMLLSNVPGPLDPVRFMGQELDDLSFYLVAPIGLYFGIVQYRGFIRAGICVDATCEPEPARLGECWAPAFQRLREASARGSAQPISPARL